MEMRLEPPSSLCLSNSAVGGGWVGTCDWGLLHRIEAPVAATVTETEPSCEAKLGLCSSALLTAIVECC